MAFLKVIKLILYLRLFMVDDRCRPPSFFSKVFHFLLCRGPLAAAAALASSCWLGVTSLLGQLKAGWECEIW